MKNILTAVLALTISSVCFAETKLDVKYSNVDDSNGEVSFNLTVLRYEGKVLVSGCTFPDETTLPTTSRIGKGEIFNQAPMTHKYTCGKDTVQLGAVYYFSVDTGLKGTFIDMELKDNVGHVYVDHYTASATPTRKN